MRARGRGRCGARLDRRLDPDARVTTDVARLDPPPVEKDVSRRSLSG